jgi:hypothetical protein
MSIYNMIANSVVDQSTSLVDNQSDDMDNETDHSNDHPIVINNCYGGYGLSQKYHDYVREMREKNPDILTNTCLNGLESSSSKPWSRRVNPEFIQRIKECGLKASSGRHADLKIEWIPHEYFEADAYDIDEYDGLERLVLLEDTLELFRARKKIRELEEELSMIKKERDNLVQIISSHSI